MLINLSNHPSAQWGEAQKKAAAGYGNTVDLPFPHIDPLATTDEVAQLAENYEVKVRALLTTECDEKDAVHLMGELTFCFALLTRLQKAGILCLTSTTQRKTVDNADGTKTVGFDFVQFREYSQIES